MLMDTGSDRSIIGDGIYEYLVRKGVKFEPANCLLRFLKGSSVAEYTVMFEFVLCKYVYRHRFLVVPGMYRNLLGRDFLHREKIGIYVGSCGWNLNPKPDNLIPFNVEIPFLSEVEFINNDGSMRELWVSEALSTALLSHRKNSSKFLMPAVPDQSPAVEVYDINESESFSSPAEILATFGDYEQYSKYKPSQEKIEEVLLDPSRGHGMLRKGCQD